MLEHHFYMDTTASRHALRDTLVHAGIGLSADADWKQTSGALSVSTSVTIVKEQDNRPDNGIVPTQRIASRDRKSYLSEPEIHGVFQRQSRLGIMALLKAYPAADAYWLAYDGAWPMLLRHDGRLVLSWAMTGPSQYWGAGR